jgi:hypothetical protein
LENCNSVVDVGVVALSKSVSVYFCLTPPLESWQQQTIGQNPAL